MPKEIDESKLNYNKYPGEHVVEFEGVVTVGTDKTFHLVQNFREGFDAEKFEQRFSELFDKYDYIVGDWGFEQLRLKGFFSTSRKKMDAATKIDHLEDYLNEYCNYGAPYFVLRRIRTKENRKKEAFNSERAIDENDRQAKLDKPKRRRNRNRNKNRNNEGAEANSYEVRDKKGNSNLKKSKVQNQNMSKGPNQKLDNKGEKGNPKKKVNSDKRKNSFVITDNDSAREPRKKNESNKRTRTNTNKTNVGNTNSNKQKSNGQATKPKQQGFVIRTRDSK